MKQEETSRFQRLVEWVEGKLPPEEAQAVAEEIAAGDEETRADVAWLQRFQQARQEVYLAAPPEDVRRKLTERFVDFAAERRQPGLLQRLVAVLTFDSGAQWATAGARSAASQGLQRQFVFTTSAAEVVLNTQPLATEGMLMLAGQIFPTVGEEPSLFSIQLLRDMDEVALVTTDELGEFFIEAIPSGEYEIVVCGDEVEIILAPVRLAAA